MKKYDLKMFWIYTDEVLCLLINTWEEVTIDASLLTNDYDQRGPLVHIRDHVINKSITIL